MSALIKIGNATYCSRVKASVKNYFFSDTFAHKNPERVHVRELNASDVLYTIFVRIY